jgi:hypothetical protein
MDDKGLQKIGAFSIKMLDMLEQELKEYEDNGTKTQVGLVHIAVEVWCENDEGEQWTECYTQSDERRGWVKSAFLWKLSEAADEMADIELTEDEEEDE